MEEKIHTRKFIESLRTDLEIRLMTKQPTTLREAFAEAQRIDKKLYDDEILRRTKHSIASRGNDPSFRSKHTISNEKPVNHALQTKNDTPTQQNPKLTREEINQKYFCKHCNMNGHSESRCFKLHPELKRRNFQSTMLRSAPPNENQEETLPFLSETQEPTNSTGIW